MKLQFTCLEILLIFRAKTSIPFFLPQIKVTINKTTAYNSFLTQFHPGSYRVSVTNYLPALDSSCPSAVQNCPYYPLSSFSTFHPPGQDRTSPEGSSCGEYTQDRDESDQQEGEANHREEDKRHQEAEDKDYNMTSVGDDTETIYAKVWQRYCNKDQHLYFR